MKTDKIFDAIADIDPSLLYAAAERRFAASDTVRKTKPAYITKIAVAAAVAAVSAAAVCVVVPFMQKNANEPALTDIETYEQVFGENTFDGDYRGETIPHIRPTLEELYNMPPYDKLLPKKLPDGYYFSDGLLTYSYKVSNRLSFGSHLYVNGFVGDEYHFFKIEIIPLSEVSGFYDTYDPETELQTYQEYLSEKGVTADEAKYKAPLIKAEDLAKEGAELLSKYKSNMIICRDYVVQYWIQGTMNDEDLYDIMTSSLYFSKY